MSPLSARHLSLFFYLLTQLSACVVQVSQLCAMLSVLSELTKRMHAIASIGPAGSPCGPHQIAGSIVPAAASAPRGPPRPARRAALGIRTPDQTPRYSSRTQQDNLVAGVRQWRLCFTTVIDGLLFLDLGVPLGCMHVSWDTALTAGNSTNWGSWFPKGLEANVEGASSSVQNTAARTPNLKTGLSIPAQFANFHIFLGDSVVHHTLLVRCGRSLHFV